MALLFHNLFPRTMTSLRFYHTCKLTSWPVSWVLAEDMKLLDQIDSWFHFHVSSPCPSAQAASVKRPRWMWQHSRFASQLRNVKLREPNFFNGLQVNLPDLHFEGGTLSVLQEYYTSVLEMKCPESKDS